MKSNSFSYLIWKLKLSLVNQTIQQPSHKLFISRERKAAVSKIRNIETISMVCILYILLNLIRLLLFLCDKFSFSDFLNILWVCQFAFFGFSFYLFVCLIIQKQLKIVVAFYIKKETKDVYENSIDLCWISLLFYFSFFFVKCPKDFHYNSLFCRC